MPQFTDSLNRPWSIAVNYQSVKQLREQLGVDLLSVVVKDSDLLTRLAHDEVLLVDVISLLLKDQIQPTGLTAEQFAEGMLGVGLQGAVDALIEGIASFSRPQKGAVIRKSWESLSQARTHARQRIVSSEMMPAIRAKVDKLVDSALATLTDSSGDSPAS